jgi:hypothetical protein
MAKGQKRSNREPKKPKQPKAARGPGLSAALSHSLVKRDRIDSGRDRSAIHDGRR